VTQWVHFRSFGTSNKQQRSPNQRHPIMLCEKQQSWV